MKAITVKQPWALLICAGIKDIENRTWKTNFRGRVLIHAGAAKTSGMMVRYLDQAQHAKFRELVGWSGLDFIEPLGAIIGSVEIVDCAINHPSIWAEKTEWKYSVGGPVGNQEYFHPVIYNWVLANPILFPKPIPAKGKQSFWGYPNILAEPEEKDGKLYCHCQLPVDEETQIHGSNGDWQCHYCGGIWYK